MQIRHSKLKYISTKLKWFQYFMKWIWVLSGCARFSANDKHRFPFLPHTHCLKINITISQIFTNLIFICVDTINYYFFFLMLLFQFHGNILSAFVSCVCVQSKYCTACTQYNNIILWNLCFVFLFCWMYLWLIPYR